ncbi:MAG: hypothetical protein GC192_21330 [Bacteroidetes bacterium]|nr:hypothetical protein [Bacteroidota bacterium]
MELATLHLDTYKVVKLLQEKGYTEKEAEGFIAAIQEITLSGVATNHALQEVRAELKADIQDVRGEIAALKIELKEDIANLKAEMLKILMVHTITIIGVMVALFTLFNH